MSTSQNRIFWVDNLRAISIISIVIVHTGRVTDIVNLYFGSFFMPAFFLVAGFFFREQNRQQTFLSFLKGRLQRLIIPYISCSVFSYILWFFVIGKFKGAMLPENPAAHFVKNLTYGVGGYGWLEYNITLWFFPCLFVAEIIFFFLFKLPSRKLLLAALFALSIVGFFIFELFNIDEFRLPFSIDIALTATVFYGLGYLAKPYLTNYSPKTRYQYPLFVLSMFVYIAFSNLNEGSAFVIGNFSKADNYFYFYLAALSGILFWAQVAMWIRPNRVFREIGSNTLVIFPLHLLLFPFFTGLLTYAFRVKVDPIETSPLWSNLLGLGYTILAISILIPVAWGLNRYAPFLLGKKLEKSLKILGS